jgi:hypothetical protein
MLTGGRDRVGIRVEIREKDETERDIRAERDRNRVSE